jgi:hypothetical protein
VVVVGLDEFPASSGDLNARDDTSLVPEIDGHRAVDVAAQALVDHRVREEYRRSWGPSVPTLVVPKVAVRPTATETRQASASPPRVPKPAKVRVQGAPPPRALRRSLWLTTICLVGATATLGAVHSGVVGHPGGPMSSTSRSLVTATVTQNRASFLTELSATASQANYSVNARTYRITISAERPSWVELGVTGSSPIFAAIVEPGAVHNFTEAGTMNIQVGAGGTNIAVSDSNQSQSLMAPVALYTFLLSPR